MSFRSSFLFMMVLVLLGVTSHVSMAAVQSRVEGPIQVKVWKHWQASWNVEEASQNTRFRLERGTSGENVAYLSLDYLTEEPVTRAVVSCRSWRRTGEWEVKESQLELVSSSVSKINSGFQFRFDKAEGCVDQLGTFIVNEISWDVFQGARSVFRYSIKPMYVRGKKNSYWNNPIDPYSAHAGSGSIQIATSLSGEAGWDKWDGILVRPILNFVDRNTLSAQAEIGLHRHEANQEMYFIEAGTAEMISGLARRTGADYRTRRQWNRNGEMKETDEFQATGGWIERRRLEPGEVAVIVPNANDQNNVYFHGIRAESALTFWTMGSKN